MEGVKNQWVRSGGRVELIREGGVNEVDEEFVREQGDSFIVCVRCGDMIWSVRQSIRSREIFARDVVKCQVELGKVEQPSGLSAVQVTRLVEVSEVFVVHKDLDCGGGAEKVVAPGI